MIHFTIEEVLASIFHALIYGAFFSLFILTLRIVVTNMKSVAHLPTYVFKYEKIISRIPKNNLDIGRFGAAFSFFSVLLFSVGFILLSYFSLDGNIRIYMLALSFAAFYLSKILFFDKLCDLINRLIGYIIFVLTVILRCVFYLPVKVFRRVRNKLAKKRDEYQTSEVNV